MKTRKWYKNMITTVISFAMIIGIFGGMKLEVCAQEYTFDVSSKDFETDIKKVTFKADDILKIDCSNKKMLIEYLKPDGNGGGDNAVVAFGADDVGSIIFLDLKSNIENPQIKNPEWTISQIKISSYGINEEKMYITFKLVDGSSSTPSSNPSSEDPNPSQEGSGSDTGASASSHECNFQWVTTVEPQPNADGLEEYMCTGCGAVQEQRSIPASMASVKNLFGFVNNVPENGTVTTDFGRLHTISDYLLKKMAERSDATVTIQFEYKNQKLQITFPAGTDYTPVLTDTDTMYGFYGVAAKLGLTVTERQ